MQPAPSEHATALSWVAGSLVRFHVSEVNISPIGPPFGAKLLKPTAVQLADVTHDKEERVAVRSKLIDWRVQPDGVCISMTGVSSA